MYDWSAVEAALRRFPDSQLTALWRVWREAIDAPTTDPYYRDLIRELALVAEQVWLGRDYVRGSAPGRRRRRRAGCAADRPERAAAVNGCCRQLGVELSCRPYDLGLCPAPSVLTGV